MINLGALMAAKNQERFNPIAPIDRALEDLEKRQCG